MEDFYLIAVLGLCALIIYIDNNYPREVVIMRKKFVKGMKLYWKALKEWESGN
jgi:hypothetical protein|tara:strand:- start:515 stop:673 length:159 start_codon:yes stop_codon:yes gene_type:complete